MKRAHLFSGGHGKFTKIYNIVVYKTSLNTFKYWNHVFYNVHRALLISTKVSFGEIFYHFYVSGLQEEINGGGDL